MIGVVGIVLSLILLIVLAYRNYSVIVLAPICALVAVAFQPDMPWLATYTQIYMKGLGEFITRFFPLFLLGAIFGKLMDSSGSAARIAKLIVEWLGASRAILALVLSCAVLTYGGVSLFVVVFTVFPLAQSLFRTADIPKRLIPATIALGSFTFTMTALPGTVQIQNLIPMPYFNTNAFAAPVLGCLGGLVMFLIGISWLLLRAAAAKRVGESYGDLNNEAEPDLQESLPAAWKALLPIVVVVLCNLVFSYVIIPRWTADYLAEPRFGATELSQVRGIWATILAMLIGVIAMILVHFRSAEDISQCLAEGAKSALLPIFNTASEFGYGSTIAALSAFEIVKQTVTGIVPQNPLISEAIAVNLLAAITGSASSGLSIALKALGETYYQRGLELGVSPELMHRVASLSCGGLDSLPHNGAVITLLIICGLTHRQSYKDIAVVSVVGPILSLIVVLTIGSLIGSF